MNRRTIGCADGMVSHLQALFFLIACGLTILRSGLPLDEPVFHPFRKFRS